MDAEKNNLALRPFDFSSSLTRCSYSTSLSFFSTIATFVS